MLEPGNTLSILTLQPMNNHLSFLNQTTLRIYTYKYKPFFMPIVITLVCIILTFTLLIPQLNNWLTIQQQIADSQRRINILTQNLNLAGKINGNVVDQYLQLVTKALPTNKDFIGILGAISNASIDSGISLNDYSFEVGDLTNNTKDQLLSLPVNISITGSFSDLIRFTSSIKKQLPLSKITNISYDGNNSGTLTIVFYYKPFPATVSFQPSQPLQTLSSSETTLLKQLIALDNLSAQSRLLIQQQLITQ